MKYSTDKVRGKPGKSRYGSKSMSAPMAGRNPHKPMACGDKMDTAMGRKPKNPYRK